MPLLKIHPVTLFISLYFSSNVYASLPIKQIDKIENQTLENSISSQLRIDQWDEKSHQLTADINEIQQKIKELRYFRDHQNALLEDQKEKITQIKQSIADIEATHQGLVPLMYKMVSHLNDWIANDLPISLNERQQHIDEIKKRLSDSSVTDAEKFKRILALYQSELEIGLEVRRFDDVISVNSLQRHVNILQIGRISLIARSPSGSEYWFFQPYLPASFSENSAVVKKNAGRWNIISSDFYSSLDALFRSAESNSLPESLTVPLSLPIVSFSKDATDEIEKE